jgi:hypothetical protein
VTKPRSLPLDMSLADFRSNAFCASFCFWVRPTADCFFASLLVSFGFAAEAGFFFIEMGFFEAFVLLFLFNFFDVLFGIIAFERD